VLVVTKADLGAAADRARRDLTQALAAVGSPREVPVLTVSSLPPGTGVEELADALEAQRLNVDVAARRAGARRSSALRELQAEHGERAVRALGGRRAAERVLAGQDPGATTAELVRLLEERISA
jgi:LAO/AO transport system kinase